MRMIRVSPESGDSITVRLGIYNIQVINLGHPGTQILPLAFTDHEQVALQGLHAIPSLLDGKLQVTSANHPGAFGGLEANFDLG